MASERFAGYYARKQTHLHKLAMVLAAAKRDELTIEVEDMEEALEIITNLETDMQHVFSSIGVSHSAKVSNEILTLIKNHGKIPLQDLWRLCYNTTAQKDFAEGVKAAISAGYVKVGKGNDGGQVLIYAQTVNSADVRSSLGSVSAAPSSEPSQLRGASSRSTG